MAEGQDNAPLYDVCGAARHPGDSARGQHPERNIQNDVDATTEGKIVSVQAGQKSEDVGYRIGATGGDTGDVGSNNCNPARTPVSITINTPTGVTVENTSGTALSAPQLTFNSCGVFQFVKFAVASSVTPGDYTITVADAGTSYNESPASFTLRVTTPPDTTAPTDASISINNAALWTNNAGGNVNLALSANDNVGVTSYRLAETQAGLATATAVSVSPAEASFSRSSVPFTLTGSEGEFKEVWLRVCDAQNNCSNASDTIGWDKTAPTITDLGPTASPNGAGWYNADVTNRFKASDSLSGLNSACVTNFPLSAGDNVQSKTTSAEGTAVNVTSDSCTDVAGNTATGVQSANFKIDKTNPNAPSATADRVPDYDGTGSNDWYKDTVIVSFSANGDPNLADGSAGSGVNLSTLSGPVTKNTSGSHTVSDTVDDNAGNTSAAGSLTVQVDATPPDLTLTCPSSPVIVGSNANAGWSATDAHSGVAGASTGTIALDTDTIGSSQTATAPAGTAKDNVNHDSAAKTCTYSVAGDFNGFLQPIDGHSVNTGKFGRTYPIKWQLRDDSGALISDSAAQLLVGTMTGGQKAVSCTSFDLADTDALEESTTGNTALRYDATSDQFIYNYKAPTSGTCYVFAIRNADGVTTQQVDFKFTK